MTHFFSCWLEREIITKMPVLLVSMNTNYRTLYHPSVRYKYIQTDRQIDRHKFMFIYENIDKDIWLYFLHRMVACYTNLYFFSLQPFLPPPLWSSDCPLYL